MIAPSDESYLETKRIRKLGLELDGPFHELASWIGNTYSVQVANIRQDTVIPDDRPRLEVILERSSEVDRFRDAGSINFNEEAQRQVKSEFLSLCCHRGRPFHDKRRLFVVFSALEPVARWEACSKVHQSQLDQIVAELGVPDLWCLRLAFDHLLIFFYTDFQAAGHEASALRGLIESKVKNLIRPHDEFGFFRTDPVVSRVDSKENFDRVYHGSWYNYLR